MKEITSLPTEADEEAECDMCAEVFPADQMVIYGPKKNQLCIDCVIETRGEGD